MYITLLHVNATFFSILYLVFICINDYTHLIYIHLFTIFTYISLSTIGVLDINHVWFGIQDERAYINKTAKAGLPTSTLCGYFNYINLNYRQG